MADKNYMNFRELLKEKQYGDAAGYLAENPELKEIINLDESLEIINYYESSSLGLISKTLSEVNGDLKSLNSKLEKSLNGERK